MAIEDLYIPTAREFDDSDSTGNPPIGVLAGTAATVAHDVQFGTTSQLIGMAHDEVSPGNALTGEDYEKSQWKRPGMTFPSGVSEARAKRSADRYDANTEYGIKMAGMSNGFLSGTGKIVGHMIGFSLDPINLGAIGLAVASVGTLSEPLLAAAAEYGFAASMGTRFAVNATIAAASMTPQAAVDYTAGTVYGEHPSALSVISSLAINSGLGGLIGLVGAKPIFGALKRIIPSSDHFIMLRTAAAQLEGGTKVNVDDLMQNGAYQQEALERNLRAEFTPKELAKNQENLKNEMVQDLETRKVEVNKLEGNEELKTQIDKQLNLLKKGEPADELQLELPELPDELRRDRLSPKQIIDGDYDEARMRGAKTDDEKVIIDAWNQLTDNAVGMAMPEISKGPVTLGQIKGAEAWLKSEKSANEYDPQEELQYKRETEQAKEDTQTGQFSDNRIHLKVPKDLERLKKEVDSYIQPGRLSSLLKLLPDNVKELAENIEDIGKVKEIPKVGRLSSLLESLPKNVKELAKNVEGIGIAKPRRLGSLLESLPDNVKELVENVEDIGKVKDIPKTGRLGSLLKLLPDNVKELAENVEDIGETKDMVQPDALPEEVRELAENIDDIEKEHNSVANAMEKYADCINRGG